MAKKKDEAIEVVSGRMNVLKRWFCVYCERLSYSVNCCTNVIHPEVGHTRKSDRILDHLFRN
jgi:hypothetical protein